MLEKSSILALGFVAVITPIFGRFLRNVYQQESFMNQVLLQNNWRNLLIYRGMLVVRVLIYAITQKIKN